MGFGSLILTFSKGWLAVEAASFGAKATGMLGAAASVIYRGERTIQDRPLMSRVTYGSNACRVC